MTAGETAGRDPLVLLEEIRANVAAAEGMALPMEARRMRRHVPRLLAGYDALLKAHQPVQVYAGADGCDHDCPPEPDWDSEPAEDVVAAWEAYEDDHPYGVTPSGENDVRICTLTPDHQACPACSALVYSAWGDDEYIDASRCMVRPLIAAALSGEEAAPS